MQLLGDGGRGDVGDGRVDHVQGVGEQHQRQDRTHQPRGGRTGRRRHGRHRGTCVRVVSFMSWFPALQGRPLVGGLTPLLRTPPPRSDTASQIFLPNSMESLTPSSYRLISRRRPWPRIRRRPPAGHVRAGRHTGGEGGVATWPSKLGRSETRRRRDRLRKHQQGAPESAAAARGVSIGSSGRYRSWSRRRVR